MLGVLVALAASACGVEPGEELPEPAQAPVRTVRQEANSTRKVLVLDSSVNGGPDSREAQAAANLNYAVHVVTPAQWRAMSAEDFMEYRALIIGDGACQAGEAAFQAAIDTRAEWGRIVDGNVVFIGADPTYNNTPQLVENAIKVAAGRNKLTGMYVALGCAYMHAPENTPVPLLEPFGTFRVAGVACSDMAHLFAMNPSTLGDDIWDDVMLQGDGCAARTVFTQYPERNLAAAAIAMNSSGVPLPGERTFMDYTWGPMPYVGTPYLLVRGASPAGSGCGVSEQPEGEECDLGDTLNGSPAQPGTPPDETCSFSCRLHWCGDGQVDEEYGEECDNGYANGRTQDSSGSIGTCSSFCKSTQPPASSPPLPACQDVNLVAQNVCGMSASIDEGSSDPDGDLVGCTQSPAGPYPIGETLVTLTCTDEAGHVASCTGRVHVQDRVVPELTLLGDSLQVLECGPGVYVEPGVTASDMCEGDLTDSIVKGGTVDPSRKGTYTRTYDVTDSAGNSAPTKHRQVRVADTLAPQLALTGGPTAGVECGSTYTEPGATAQDQCAGDLTASIVTSGTVNAAVPGSYTLHYSVMDPEGLRAELERTVAVADTLPPMLVLQGPSQLGLECGEAFVDPSAKATDVCFGDITHRVTWTGSVDPGAPGSYVRTYQVTDPAGQSAQAVQRTIQVDDTQRPIITLAGPLQQQVECGTTYADSGATAHDACAGELPALPSDTVDPRELGTTEIHYSATDPSGNTATTADPRTVTVADTLPPVLTLQGSATESAECGMGYQDPGARATDLCAGDVSNRIVVTGSVDPRALGNHTLSYSVTDPTGNAASAAQRTVAVADTLPPVLTLRGSAAAMVECGMDYEDAGATATDLCAGDVSGRIVVSGGVDPRTVGSYMMSFSVSDPSGNAASSAQRAVAVADTLPPMLTLRGSATERVECGSRYEDPGAAAMDLCAGDLSGRIVINGQVDASAVGSYTVSYSVADPSGNTASAAQRTVSVTDTLPPRIECPAALVTEAIEGSLAPVTLGEATAVDDCDRAVRVSGPERRTLFGAGTTTLTYVATDASGNQASCTTSVTVQMLTLPDTWIVQAPAEETEDTHATFSFKASKEDVTYECSLDGVDFFQCSELHTFEELAEGPHAIQVRARDSRGLVDPTPAAATWVVTVRKPELWDGALLGGGHGCAASGGGSASLAMLGLVLISLLEARKRRR